MSEDAAPGPIRLALVIEDPALADRLAALLAGVPGLRLVGATEAADAAVVTSTVVSPLLGQHALGRQLNDHALIPPHIDRSP